AFGNTAPIEDVDGDTIKLVFNQRFPGQRYDAASGLNYNMRRDYDSGTGRYIESDPIGLKGGNNTYRYVDADPMTGIDPRGLIKIYGFWCGPDWTGGRKEEFSPEHIYRRPVDRLDTSCMNHDMCYYTCRAGFPCDKSGRSECFRNCDYNLTKEAYAVGGFWGRTIGAAIDRPGERDSGPDSPECIYCDRPKKKP
ncbi:RHS repeat-associated core domain-containing protein, partial [Lysobacter terrae]